MCHFLPLIGKKRAYEVEHKSKKHENPYCEMRPLKGKNMRQTTSTNKTFPLISLPANILFLSTPRFNSKRKNSSSRHIFTFISLLALGLVFLFQALLPSTVAYAAAEREDSGHKKLLVGTKEAPPFSFKDQAGQWQGISIELWRTIAEENNWPFELLEYDLPGLLQAVEKGEIDVALAALTVTAEREKKFDFSHAFYTTGLGIAVRPGNESSWLAVFNRFFSLDFMKITGALSLLLLTFGFLVWFFEHRKNTDQFGGSTLQGIGSGFWWSAVTMTTVGYGDKSPQTFGGRLVGLVWMFTAIIVISSFTASITSTLTVSKITNHIKGPSDLVQVKVGSMDNSTSSAYLDDNHIVYRHYLSPLAALHGLVAGEIDAVVYDAPILRYYANNEMKFKVAVLNIIFEKQLYGIGLPAGSNLREELNHSLLSFTRQLGWQDILFKYLGNLSAI